MQGSTIIISEHRLHYLKEIADRYVYMENGVIKNDFKLEELQDISVAKRNKMGLRMLGWDELSQKNDLISNSGKTTMRLQNFYFSRNKKNF